MEQHSKLTGQQIATRAQELKLVFLGLTMALPFLCMLLCLYCSGTELS